MPLPVPIEFSENNSCQNCQAVCCRLTVVLMPDDHVPAHLTTVTPEGLHVMAREVDGWCAALDPLQMCCTIYAQRPSTCRRFVMDGPYCRATREDFHKEQLASLAATPHHTPQR